jgi:predicted DNA-binding transcriptional regulator AlpA
MSAVELLAADRLVTKREVAEALGMTVRSLERHISTGEFPRPMALGGWRRWRLSTVRKHLDKLSRESEKS